MSFFEKRYEVIVIKEGSCKEESGTLHGSTGVTLVVGTHTAIVGTGLPQDRQLIMDGLSDYSVAPEDVEYVVCPYGHVECTGNLSLFPKATLIVGYNIMQGVRHLEHDFNQDIPYEIDEDLEVLPTPGRYAEVVSVVCRRTAHGTVAIAPGAFHNEVDLDKPEFWADVSLDADTQQDSRIEVLKEADYIIPRYGPMYKVPACYKTASQGMVMTPPLRKLSRM